MKDTCSFQSLFCEITEFLARKRRELSADTEFQFIAIYTLDKCVARKQINIYINSFSEILIRLLLKNNVLVKDMPHKS